MAVWLDAVLQAEELQLCKSDLDTSLAGVLVFPAHSRRQSSSLTLAHSASPRPFCSSEPQYSFVHSQDSLHVDTLQSTFEVAALKKEAAGNDELLLSVLGAG